MIKTVHGILTAVFFAGPVLFGQEPTPSRASPPTGPIPAPEWVKHLVVYEIATKAFTSPHGPESGTFASLQAKVPYLKSLGINGIWLTGHSLSNRHFFNIWTQYACVDPFQLDPTLGSEADFKSLIDACHQAGIHVILDVITHGLVNESPLIAQHPEWFKPGSWNMTDYKWESRNPALEKWWVDGWTNMVSKYGVDGFRLDCGFQGSYDPWREIRNRCADMGHPVVICSEPCQIIDGVDEFTQYYMPLAFGARSKMYDDVPGAIHDNYGGPGQASHAKGFLGSVQISCHDYGWPPYPLDKNPYVVCGSRYLMGYTLFSPAIPIFMSGEEFDCDFQALPELANNLYNGADPGKGRWLYGSMINWTQIEQPRHQDMLKDVTHMLAIRSAHADLLCAEDITSTPQLAAVPVQGDIKGLPVPYIRWKGNDAILVAANSTDQTVNLSLKIPASTLGWSSKEVTITDEWHNQPAGTLPVADGVVDVSVKIGPDKTAGGGLAVLSITAK